MNLDLQKIMRNLYWLPFIQYIAYQVSYITATVLLVTTVFIIFIGNGINRYSEAMFGAMIYGTAYRPFVYRALLPSIVRLVIILLPPNVRTIIIHSSLRFPNWESDLLTEYIIACIFMLVSLIGFCFALKYLFKGLFEAPKILADVVSSVALAGLPIFMKSYPSYIYDFPTLFLFTLGLGLMVHRKWQVFVLVFLLACFNKETTILLTLIFIIYFFNRWTLITPKRFFQLISLQLIIFVLTRVYITWSFRNNPGSSLEFHLFDHNINLLLSSYTLPNFVSILGITMLVFHQWAEKPIFLRCSISILVPLLGMTFFFGYLDELRDYYEVYPIIFLLIFQTVGNILGAKFIPLTMSTRYPKV